MQILTDIQAVHSQITSVRSENKSIALVPTMGFLHAGHLSLVERAKSEADYVIVSRFVNPTQFAVGEDLDAYPSDQTHDHRVINEAGANMIFEPASMYTDTHSTWVDLPNITSLLCGKTRPTHFRGVCTIVTKLFNIIRPDVAIFGEKDWQQLTIIRIMVEDLNMPVRIIGCPIVRETDGLALSSRNAYLTDIEREHAPAIRAGLLQVQNYVQNGEADSSFLSALLRDYLTKHAPMSKIDYIAFAHPQTLQEKTRVEGQTLVAVAVYMGKARLLDNILIG